MHILLLAPHPFYQERGTPIAVDLLLHAMVKRGYRVDVLTYHEGETRDYGPSVSIRRISAPRWISGIRPGFTLKKLFCDAIMAPHAMRLATQQDYDCIHAVEESVFMAQRISRKTGIPYVYDMDSSMSRQIADKLPFMSPLLRPMRAMEHKAIRGATAVVPMCDALADDARQAGAAFVEVLRDISLLPSELSFKPELGFRKATGISGPAVLYVGNLESYQGIGLLLESTAALIRNKREISIVIAGGRKDDIEHYRQKASELGIAAQVHFMGPQPVENMPHLFHDADMLISPRTQGQNTPMKIYSYLDSDRPIVATRLPTHTQVLNDDVAILTDPNADSMAQAIARLLDDKKLANRLATQARDLAQKHYSQTAFERAVNHLYEHIENVVKLNQK